MQGSAYQSFIVSAGSSSSLSIDPALRQQMENIDVLIVSSVVSSLTKEL